MTQRILTVLGLFRARSEPLTVEDIARATGVSQSSAYRDIQELSRSGFLDPVSGAGYVLGPAFIEYDRLLRQRDRLIPIAAESLRKLLDDTTQHATAILCRRYRDTVMCVHQEQGTQPHPITTYERGVAMPLFAGASSKVILAHLDDRALKRIYLENERTIRDRLGHVDWRTFKEEMRAIRRIGVVKTSSEVALGRVAIAAPILVNKQVIAGVSLVFAEEAPAEAEDRFRRCVMETADAISAAVAQHDVWMTR